MNDTETPTEVRPVERAECHTEPRHEPVYFDPDPDAWYPPQCPLCHIDTLRVQADQCHHHAWRRWDITSKVFTKLVMSGAVTSGYSYVGSMAHRGCLDGWPRLRGRRRYILGIDRDTWHCWRRRHRRGDPIGFGLCAKCVPCPDCGSKTIGHADACPSDPWGGDA